MTEDERPQAMRTSMTGEYASYDDKTTPGSPADLRTVARPTTQLATTSRPNANSSQAVQVLFQHLANQIENSKPTNIIGFIVDFLCKNYPEHLSGFASIWNSDPELEKERLEVVSFFKYHKISSQIAAHFTSAGYDTLETLSTLTTDSLPDIESFNSVRWLPGHKVRLGQVFSDVSDKVREYRQRVMMSGGNLDQTGVSAAGSGLTPAANAQMNAAQVQQLQMQHQLEQMKAQMAAQQQMMQMQQAAMGGVPMGGMNQTMTMQPRVVSSTTRVVSGPGAGTSTTTVHNGQEMNLKTDSGVDSPGAGGGAATSVSEASVTPTQGMPSQGVGTYSLPQNPNGLHGLPQMGQAPGVSYTVSNQGGLPQTYGGIQAPSLQMPNMFQRFGGK